MDVRGESDDWGIVLGIKWDLLGYDIIQILFDLDWNAIGRQQSFYFAGMGTTYMFVASCNHRALARYMHHKIRMLSQLLPHPSLGAHSHMCPTHGMMIRMQQWRVVRDC